MLKIPEHQAMLDTLGNRIKEAIKGSGLTQAYVADKCGVSKQAPTGWFKTNSIDKSNLMTVSKVTKYSYEWLLTGKGEKLQKNLNEGTDSYLVGPDKSLLIQAIVQTEAMIKKHKIKPTDDVKAAMIADCYEGLMHEKKE